MVRPLSIPLLLLLATLLLAVFRWAPLPGHEHQVASEFDRTSARASIDSIRHYEDNVYEFSMAVPSNWKAIQANDVDDGGELNSGYSIGFTSPRFSEEDPYSEYVMVELLPGIETGAFETDGSSRQVITIDGAPAIRDRLFIPADPDATDSVELVVYQAQIIEPGFTIGIYAVGEISEADWLKDAFEIVLRTITIPKAPFQVS